MINMYKLSNGIRVVSEKLNYFRTATFGVWVRAGSVNEGSNEGGLAHMLEHMFFKGTLNKTAKELADSIALIGDDVNAFTSKEYTAFYGTTTSGHVPAIVALIGEMLFESLFDEKDIRKEKRVVLDEIDMYEDSPEDLVHDMIQKNVYNGHPLANVISGSKASVRKFKRDDLISFKDKHYVPSNMVISIAGNYDEDKLTEQLEEIFGRFVKQESIKEDADISGSFDISHEPVYNKCFCYKYKDIEQAHVNLAFPSIKAGSEERFALNLMNSIFGGSNNSRLFQTIREESGLAYSVYSYTSEFMAAGLFHIDVTVNPVKVINVLDMIHDIINKIRVKGIDEKELEIHKSQIVTELIMGNESTKARMSSNAKSVFLRDYAITLDENLAGIEAVKADEVHKLASSCINMEDISISAVGSKKDMDIKRLKDWWKKILL